MSTKGQGPLKSLLRILCEYFPGVLSEVFPGVRDPLKGFPGLGALLQVFPGVLSAVFLGVVLSAEF